MQSNENIRGMKLYRVSVVGKPSAYCLTYARDEKGAIGMGFALLLSHYHPGWELEAKESDNG